MKNRLGESFGIFTLSFHDNTLETNFLRTLFQEMLALDGNADLQKASLKAESVP